MYGGKYYMDFVTNLLLFPAVKEFGKFVKNWQSYRHDFNVRLFGTQCRCAIKIAISVTYSRDFNSHASTHNHTNVVKLITNYTIFNLYDLKLLLVINMP